MSDLRVRGDLSTLRDRTTGAKAPSPNGERECPDLNHRGSRAVPIERFWDRKAGVLRKTCAHCRHNRKVARRRKHANPRIRHREDADQFWTEQAANHK